MNGIYEKELKDNDLFYKFNEYKKQVIKIMEKYSFDEAFSYTFVINSFITNKPFYSISCLLNASLCECNTFVECEKNYNRMKGFFDDIKDIIQKTDYKDNIDSIANDIGFCKIKFEDNTYSFILGTGYNNTYAMVRAIPLFEQDKEVGKSIFKYHSSMIEVLYRGINDKQESVFSMPTKEYFDVAIALLEKINIPTFIKETFRYVKGYSYKSHAFNHNDKYYPLFNVAILIDYYAFLVANNKLELEELINKRAIENYSCLEFNKGILHYPCRIINKTKKEKLDYLLIGCSNDGSIFFLQESKYDKSVIEKEKEILMSCDKNTTVSFIERIARSDNGSLGITLMDNFNELVLIRDLVSPYSIDMIGKNSNDIFSISFNDLIFLMDFANIDEIRKFIKSFSELENVLITNMDIPSAFYVWKANGGVMFQGTIDIGSLMYENNMGDHYAYEQFEILSKWYPLNENDYMFSNPFAWEYDKEGHIAHKSNHIIIGTMKKIYNEAYTFYYFNHDRMADYINTPMGKHVAKYVDDYINMLVDEYGKYLIKFPYKIFEFMFSPMSDNERINHQKIGKYFYINVNSEHNTIHFLFDLDVDLLQRDLVEPKDCSIEIASFLEIVDSIYYIHPLICNEIKEKIFSDINGLPHMKTIKFECHYFFDASSFCYIRDLSFIEARKQISVKLDDMKLKETKFTYEDAYKVEQIFCFLYKNLVEEIKKYNQEKTRVLLLDSVSNYISNRDIDISRIRGNSGLASNTLDKSLSISYEDKVKMDEFIRDFVFLIDINEATIRDASSCPSLDDIGYFLAYARWISILKTQSLALEFKDKSITLTIDYESLPQIEESEQMLQMDKLKKERQKKYTGYTIKHDDLDKEYFLKLALAFEKDTAIKLGDLWDFIKFLSIGKEIESKRINYNVIKISTNDMKSYLLKNNFTNEVIDSIVKYLTVDSTMITVADKEYDYVPFHNRTKRRSSISFKPLIKNGDYYIYSPALLYNLLTLMKNGFLDFFPPYHDGLKETLSLIKKWKKSYENSIEVDLCSELKKKDFFFVGHSITLSTFDKLAQHPSNLGDYDVIAIDNINKILYLFECKVLSKCGSYFETNRQQYGFFYEDKYDEKFQRRIDYVNANLAKVLKSFKIVESTGYSVKAYMVTNKNFVSLYKRISFEILMYDEVLERIK